MEKRLSHKEKGFVKDIVKGKTGTQAILDNYDTESEHVAGVMAVNKLGNARIQKAIKSIADSIPDEDLITVHKEGLKAGKLKEDGAIEPDYATRHKYMDSGYKLKGSYAPDKQSVVIEESQASEKVKELMNLLNEQKRKR